MHCFQSQLKQYDKDGWVAEHDASFLSGSVLYSLASCPSAQYIFSPGLYEDLMVNWEEEVQQQKNLFTTLDQEYVNWRNTCGLHKPTDVVPSTPGASYYFKNRYFSWIRLANIHRISFDELTQDRTTLQHQLECCFRGRTGDLTKLPPPALRKS